MRDSFSCTYCEKDLHNAKRDEITLDHVVCRIAGGTHEANNLVTACRTCNSKRADKSVREFASPEALRRIKNQTRRQLNSSLAKSLLVGKAA